MAEPHMPAEPVTDEGTLERQPARPKLPLRVDARRQYAVADFPGCRPVRIPRDEIDSWEGRFEFWDARTEVAMVAEPVTTYHEYPSQRLTRLTEIIAHSRGSSIITVGTADLLLRTDTGAKAQIMQADQTVYLHPDRDRPQGAAMEVGEKLPDVVLEVDHTTDVYRRKFDLYEEWGFPELWVEVPDAESPSRPKRKVPGLRIHVLGASGRFEERAASAAFAGWTATDIHRALNEETPSAETTATLRRIGRALGVREGTGPDDSLFLKAERDEGRQAGLQEGRQEGLHEGRQEGLQEGRQEGWQEGHLAGQRELLRALAAMRFGATSAQTLAPLLAQVGPEQLARFGAGLLQGATEEELAAMLAGP